MNLYLWFRRNSLFIRGLKLNDRNSIRRDSTDTHVHRQKPVFNQLWFTSVHHPQIDLINQPSSENSVSSLCSYTIKLSAAEINKHCLYWRTLRNLRKRLLDYWTLTLAGSLWNLKTVAGACVHASGVFGLPGSFTCSDWSKNFFRHYKSAFTLIITWNTLTITYHNDIRACLSTRWYKKAICLHGK